MPPSSLRGPLLTLAMGTALVGLLERPAAATPHPFPASPMQLACNLSDRDNSDDYRAWWSRVAGSVTYRTWFWYSIVPFEATNSCAADVARLLWQRAAPENWDMQPRMSGWPWPTGGYFTQTLWLRAIPGEWGTSSPIRLSGAHPPTGYYAEIFWARAVPENWASRGRLAGWPWASGGYYTQYLWLYAIPDNWASVPNIGGWPWSSGGGYYTQRFWLQAVPDNWAMIGNIGGWSWSSGGYYTQFFWLQAVPDNWAPRTGLKLGRGWYAQDGQGYYRFWFWKSAVPNGWAVRPNVGFYHSSSGGYYEQWFWLGALPHDWAVSSDYVVAGFPGRGYYHYWTYHFAVPRGFAWRSSATVRGMRGAGYYHKELRDVWRHRHLMAAALYNELQGYLPPGSGGDTVDRWFDPDARAVVVLSFDTEGTADQSCALSEVLRDREVPASFMITGGTAGFVARDGRWAGCLEGFDIGNHTQTHVGGMGFRVPRRDGAGLFNMYDSLFMGSEVARAGTAIRSTFGVTARSFRTPWCDGHKSLDSEVLRVLLREGIEVDSSMANVGEFNLTHGLVPPADLKQMGNLHRPYPFVFRGGDDESQALVELPFAYPSDWTARNVLARDTWSNPPNNSDLRYAPNIWAGILDETIDQRGIMVLVLHPHSLGPGALAGLIDRVQARPGVRFSTMSEVNRRYRAYRGLPARP